MTRGAIVVWAKALAGGEQTSGGQERPIKRQRGYSKSPVYPNKGGCTGTWEDRALFRQHHSRAVHDNCAALLLTDLER